MKLRHLLLSALLTFSFATAQADNLNQPEMLGGLSAEHMDTMSIAAKKNTRGERFWSRNEAFNFCLGEITAEYCTYKKISGASWKPWQVTFKRFDENFRRFRSH